MLPFCGGGGEKKKEKRDRLFKLNCFFDDPPSFHLPFSYSSSSTQTNKQTYKQAKLLLLCRRALATPVARGMLTLGSLPPGPLLAEPLPIPSICLAGVLGKEDGCACGLCAFLMWARHGNSSSNQPINQQTNKQTHTPTHKSTGRVPPTNATVHLDTSAYTPDLTLWPEFHNGVAAGLR